MDLNMKSVESNNNCAPERFSGQNFKRWQACMKFWLTTLGLFSVIDAPSILDSKEEPGRTHALKVQKEQDYLCHGKICSRLEDNLFDIYYQIPSAHDLWYALEKKYSTEDAGLEKYHVGKYLDFKMIEGKSIIDQTHELQHLVLELNQAGIPIHEKFAVAVIIEKLPDSWKKFGLYLKHKRETISLDDLLVSLQIEEKAHERDIILEPSSSVFQAKVNVMVGQKPKFKKKNFQKKSNNLGPNQKIKKDKSKVECYVCHKNGHYARECYQRKGKKGKSIGGQVNMTIGGDSTASGGGYVSYFPEVNMVYQLDKWWIDSGANVHVCANRSAFVSYQESDGRVTKGDASVAQMCGQGRVDLKLTSGKVLSLHGVLHVPKFRKNLISGYHPKTDIKLYWNLIKL
ncbi:hypothetical protein LWI29_008782 [Acer saccharum]|uniref:CCHC-type domain-containing protein n=1 Tax=Acer saccharum TaxID=4024 RepID=A0AA39T446_ACESA|nr:hypothetical protein LWI29_008782 [Acer saccharum]